MIEVQNLVKRYGDTLAVDGVSFTARPGAIFGLLGPNGAGKSTTIGCLSGLVEPSSGSVRVLGHDVISDGRAAREALGVVPQELAIYEDLSAAENLEYWGAAWGLAGKELGARVREVLADVGLADRAKEPVKRFSGGMKRRLNFGAGIVHRPRVLLLDEPTVGVDPQSRVKLIELVRAEARRGTCVLYTTHYMEEAETLCAQLAILDHGKVLAAGTLEELRASLGERDLVFFAGRFDVEHARAALAGLADVEVVQASEAELALACREASKRLPQLLAALASSGEVRETTLRRPSLESLFIKLTGKELRE
ncbi:MAG: ABC transporter ATP-binding protein [Planctomycetes bacterium]|nr:ABC transporter ATP-binding protein [Planctomycetota bacterium]